MRNRNRQRSLLDWIGITDNCKGVGNRMKKAIGIIIAIIVGILTIVVSSGLEIRGLMG